MTSLFFYTTLGCHLCEQADELLADVMDDRYQVTAVEISESDELIERYGIRIPVLRREDTGSELGWPFDAEALLEFLA